MIKKQVTVGSSVVDRPIAMLVQTAGKFASSLHLQLEEKNVNLKSIMGVISIGALDGKNVVITADGADEADACDTIIEFLK